MPARQQQQGRQHQPTQPVAIGQRQGLGERQDMLTQLNRRGVGERGPGLPCVRATMTASCPPRGTAATRATLHAALETDGVARGPAASGAPAEATAAARVPALTSRPRPHLQKEALLPNGVRAEYEEWRGTPGGLLDRGPAEPHHLRHNVPLRWEAVLRGAVRGIQVEDGPAAQSDELRAGLEEGPVIAAVARVKHRCTARPLKDHHRCTRAMVGRHKCDEVRLHLEGLPEGHLFDPGGLHLQRRAWVGHHLLARVG